MQIQKYRAHQRRPSGKDFAQVHRSAGRFHNPRQQHRAQRQRQRPQQQGRNPAQERFAVVAAKSTQHFPHAAGNHHFGLVLGQAFVHIVNFGGHLVFYQAHHFINKGFPRNAGRPHGKHTRRSPRIRKGQHAVQYAKNTRQDGRYPRRQAKRLKAEGIRYIGRHQKQAQPRRKMRQKRLAQHHQQFPQGQQKQVLRAGRHRRRGISRHGSHNGRSNRRSRSRRTF